MDPHLVDGGLLQVGAQPALGQQGDAVRVSGLAGHMYGGVVLPVPQVHVPALLHQQLADSCVAPAGDPVTGEERRPVGGHVEGGVAHAALHVGRQVKAQQVLGEGGKESNLRELRMVGVK